MPPTPQRTTIYHRGLGIPMRSPRWYLVRPPPKFQEVCLCGFVSSMVSCIVQSSTRWHVCTNLDDILKLFETLHAPSLAIPSCILHKQIHESNKDLRIYDDISPAKVHTPPKSAELLHYSRAFHRWYLGFVDFACFFFGGLAGDISSWILQCWCKCVNICMHLRLRYHRGLITNNFTKLSNI